MEFVALGKSGEKLPVLGMGTWKLGADRELAIRTLREGIKNGLHYIDTAEMYANEDMVGEAIKGEKGLFIATKVSPNHFREKDVIQACNSSLKKLGVKQIDLYQLHWPNSGVPIEETMRAMERLVKEGKIGHIGVSNFSVDELRRAQEVMKGNEIVSNQVEYSLFVRDPERGMSDFCRKSNVTMIAYSPLGSGAFYDNKYEGAYKKLEEIGTAYEKSATQVALNWLISKGNLSAIPKAGSPEHLVDNLGAVGWHLSSADMMAIDKLGYRKKSMAGGVFKKRIVPFFVGAAGNSEKRRMAKSANVGKKEDD